VGFTPVKTELTREAGALKVRDIGGMPSSWSISMSGWFYNTTQAVSRDARTVSQDRIREPVSWRRRVGPQGDDEKNFNGRPRCLWPPSPEQMAGRRRLQWSKVLGEGDRVGLLVTTFGGLVLFLNGQRELMIPDANVNMDVELYPVFEASNHVRSVRLVPGALPAP